MKLKTRYNRGFSLPELMVVILILGIALAASIPAFGNFMESYRLTNEADQLASMLRTARSAAIMKNTTAILAFDTDTNTYEYFEDDDNSGGFDNGEYKSALKTFPAGMSIDSHTLTVAQVSFGPKGNCLEGGTITLAAVASSEKTKTIRIMTGTGNVQVD